MATKHPEIDARIARIESSTGKPVVLRPVRPTNCCFRGRVCERQSAFVVEYRNDSDDHAKLYEILRDLLDCIDERRGQKITLYDGDVQYVEIPLHRARKGNRPPPRS